MDTRAAPKVYETRPTCKWHGYNCHRAVEEGQTLCPMHIASAKASKRLDYHRADGKADKLLGGLWSDPGCDCETCLRRM